MSSKWQRIRYMPPKPLYDGQERVTGGPAHIALTREAAADGMVLLKNIDAAHAYTDTAMVVLCRYSVEDSDRTALPQDGDFHLSEAEETMVDQVLATFDRVIVVLNTDGMMDTSWCHSRAALKAAMQRQISSMAGFAPVAA